MKAASSNTVFKGAKLHDTAVDNNDRTLLLLHLISFNNP